MKRREFLSGSVAVGAGVVVSSSLRGVQAADRPVSPPRKPKGGQKMSFEQPKLPYALDALRPFLTEEQMNYHYNKHHAAYFKNLNGLVEGKPEAKLSLRELVIQAPAGPVFNNAGQAWNHSFFWNCMLPSGGGDPKGDLLAAIEKSFGSLDAFKKDFSDKAAKLFGSGWAWLAADKQGKLEIMALSNADTPLKHDREPILTIDVWEHAYYVDYRNERPKFIEGFWSKVNWDFAARCLAEPSKS